MCVYSDYINTLIYSNYSFWGKIQLHKSSGTLKYSSWFEYHNYRVCPLRLNIRRLVKSDIVTGSMMRRHKRICAVHFHLLRLVGCNLRSTWGFSWEHTVLSLYQTWDDNILKFRNWKSNFSVDVIITIISIKYISFDSQVSVLYCALPQTMKLTNFMWLVVLIGLHLSSEQLSLSSTTESQCIYPGTATPASVHNGTSKIEL